MNRIIPVILLATFGIAFPAVHHLDQPDSPSMIESRDGTTEFDPDFFLKA
ncbi:hypothetical protein ANO14919_125880 [Xylariales sp. No.14919]|nr:hypothetical protein ANO14919_125880 [Xylariales sp. No.14919]